MATRLAIAFSFLALMLGGCPSTYDLGADDDSQGTSSSGSSSSGTAGSESANGSSVTTTSTSATETVLYAAADTYVESMSPEANFGSGQALYTGVVNFGTGRDDYFTAFIKFDLGTIPRGAHIEEAKLKLTTDANASLVKPTGTVTVATVTGTSWTEGGVTYLNMPSTGTYVVAREITFDTATTWDFPVTGAVQKWVDGTTNRGFSVKSRSFSPNEQCYGTFYANELAPDGGPRLYVRWR